MMRSHPLFRSGPRWIGAHPCHVLGRAARDLDRKDAADLVALRFGKLGDGTMRFSRREQPRRAA